MPKFNSHPINIADAIARVDRQRCSDMEDQPLLATTRQACKMLNCGRTTVFDLLNQGVLERVKIGRATRVTVRSIAALAGQ